MTADRIGKTVALAIVVVSVIGVAAFRRDPGAGLQTATVTRGAFVDVLQLRGQVRPVRSIVLTGPSAGGTDLLILDIAKNGAAVAAGDVIVEFDATQQQRTLEQKQSELKQADADIEKAESEQRRRVGAAETDLSQARSAVERARLDMARVEVQSRVDGEKLKIALENAGRHVDECVQKLEGERLATAADVAAGKQKREKASFDVRETERIIASLTMRAPSAGSVSLMPNYRAGGTARSAPEFKRGDRAWFGAPIAEMPDLSSVQLMCRIDEADRARVLPGLATRVSVDALPDRELAGTVVQIAIVAKPDFTTWPPVRNFDLVVGLSDADKRLRSGMSATARVELERLNDVVLVPAGTVFQHAGSTVAYVVQGRSVQARQLEILRRGRDQVAVSSGLREGERVALKEPGTEGGAR
jgi:multidrug efflux pump subunit AcrA (membrane-fusion protein)